MYLICMSFYCIMSWWFCESCQPGRRSVWTISYWSSSYCQLSRHQCRRQPKTYTIKVNCFESETDLWTYKYTCDIKILVILELKRQSYKPKFVHLRPPNQFKIIVWGGGLKTLCWRRYPPSCFGAGREWWSWSEELIFDLLRFMCCI